MPQQGVGFLCRGQVVVKHSLPVASQVPVREWQQLMTDPTVADAVLAQVVSHLDLGDVQRFRTRVGKPGARRHVGGYLGGFAEYEQFDDLGGQIRTEGYRQETRVASLQHDEGRPTCTAREMLRTRIGEQNDGN
jgi:hypothetical protein